MLALMLLGVMIAWLFVMLLLRSAIGTSRQRVATLKGWDRHARDAGDAHKQFLSFLNKRAPGQTVSIRRSKAGEKCSNRTTSADYKKESLVVDLTSLTAVVAIDKDNLLIHVEPGITMDDILAVSFAHGLVPLVVLEFPGITAGGALCGGGLESSSHRFGSFIEVVEDIDVIIGDGTHFKNVSRVNEPDLFHAMSVSFGSIGIVTRLAIRVRKALPYVYVRYLHTAEMAQATEIMERLSAAPSPPSFIDGVAIGPSSCIVVVGEECASVPDAAPFITLRQKRTDPWFYWHLDTLARTLPFVAQMPQGDGWRNASCYGEYMTLSDYLFRFDRGAFWMARDGLQMFFGSLAYDDRHHAPAGPSTIIRMKYAWLCTTRQLYKMLHSIGDELLARSYVIQDFIMPSRVHANRFVNRISPELSIWPLWLCPVRAKSSTLATNTAGFGFPKVASSEQLFFNVGIYGRPYGGAPFDPVVTNAMLENLTSVEGGRKMLYAQNYYSVDAFWELFDKRLYEKLRGRYAGERVFPDICSKVLLGGKKEAMRGVQRTSFRQCAGAMARWYSTLWLELLLPWYCHRFAGLD